MEAYGEFKTRSTKLHGYDDCDLCAEKTISKKKARRAGKEEIDNQLSEYFDYYSKTKPQ